MTVDFGITSIGLSTRRYIEQTPSKRQKHGRVMTPLSQRVEVSLSQLSQSAEVSLTQLCK
jgi:hypothetical protein